MHLFIWKINNSTIFLALVCFENINFTKEKKRQHFKLHFCLQLQKKIYMAKAEVFIWRYKALFVISQSKTFLRNIRYKKLPLLAFVKSLSLIEIKKSCKMPQIVAVETFDSMFVQVGNVHGHGKICYWKRTIFSVFGFSSKLTLFSKRQTFWLHKQSEEMLQNCFCTVSKLITVACTVP